MLGGFNRGTRFPHAIKVISNAAETMFVAKASVEVGVTWTTSRDHGLTFETEKDAQEWIDKVTHLGVKGLKANHVQIANKFPPKLI